MKSEVTPPGLGVLQCSTSSVLPSPLPVELQPPPASHIAPSKLSFASSILSCLQSSWLPLELRVASLALCCPSSLASGPSQYAHAIFPKTIKEEGKKLKKNKPSGPSRQVKRALCFLPFFISCQKYHIAAKRIKEEDRNSKKHSVTFHLSRGRNKEEKKVGENSVSNFPHSRSSSSLALRASLFANFHIHILLHPSRSSPEAFLGDCLEK